MLNNSGRPLNPANRILKRVDVADAAAADHVFSTLMGNEVPPRKSLLPLMPKQLLWIYN